MQLTYEFEIWRGQKQWIAEAFDLPCMTQGENMQDLCESTADILREYAFDCLMSRTPLPKATFENAPTHEGILMVVSVEANLSQIQKITASEAANMLGVTRGRISAMLSKGLLDGWREGRNTYVTLASVQSRLESTIKPGRPKVTQLSIQ